MGWQEWQGCRNQPKSIGATQNAPQNTPQKCLQTDSVVALSRLPRSRSWGWV